MDLIRGKRIQLRDFSKQDDKDLENKLWQFAGAARFIWNWFLEYNFNLNAEYHKNNKTGKRYMGANEFSRMVNEKKHDDAEYKWLCNISCNVIKHAIQDADDAYREWIRGEKGKPKFKTKYHSRPSFYVNYERFKKVDGGFQGEKLGKVKTKHPLPTLPKGWHYSNPRMVYENNAWMITFGIPTKQVQTELNDFSLGYDLGISRHAVVSNGDISRNINKDETVRKLTKRLKRQQRALSRKLEANTDHYEERNGYPVPVYKRPLSECKNIQKVIKEIQKTHKRIKDIHNNHIHQFTASLVKQSPKRIVGEDLNIRGMMKNRHLSKSIGEMGWYETRRQLNYKCENHGIEHVLADRFYASSKTCSCCGAVKKHLKLSERIYVCEECGATLDRDLNAAINLSRYTEEDFKIAQEKAKQARKEAKQLKAKQDKALKKREKELNTNTQQTTSA